MGEQGPGLGRIATRRATDVGIIAVVLLPALASYHRAIDTSFAQDDITFLSRAAGLEHAGAPFRPLSAGLAFRLQYLAFGLDPRPWHVVSLLLHLLVVAGVYALGRAVAGGRTPAAVAAILFGCSSIAFTPLHWTSGVAELLAAVFLIGATLLHLRARTRGQRWRWVAAGVALLAMLSKETAAAWVLVVAVIEWQANDRRLALRPLVPALAATAVFGIFLAWSGRFASPERSGAYAWTLDPSAVLLNLLTYARWSVEVWNPIRDAIAGADPLAWRVAVPAIMAAGAVHSWLRPAERATFGWGLAWWLAFVLPVLPLVHHAYLYYLYIPAIGGSLALAAATKSWLERQPGLTARAAGLAALGAVVVMEMLNVRARETATRDSLPVDRTLRDALLLDHSIPALRAAGLPAGTQVLFVSPRLRPRFDLVTGAPTRPEDAASRTSYLPLEAAMRGGETLRLFVPQVVYAGFARTIPDSLGEAECFHFDQRGRLERWGRGPAALARQSEVLEAKDEAPVVGDAPR